MNIGTLTVLMGVNTAGLRRGVIDMQRFERSVLGSLGRMEQAMQQTGLAMTQMVTVPIAAVGAAATKSFMTYEKTMTEIVGLNGIAAKTTRQWSDEVMKLAPATAQGPEKLAEGLKFITGSGITSAEAMNVLKVSAMGATAGLGDVQTLAKATTSAILAYGRGNMTAERAVNSFLLTIREGVGAPEEFVQQMGGVFQIASKVGVQIEEVGAALAALTQQGISAAEAETQLKSFLRAMVQQSPEAEQALNDIGLSFDKLLQNLKSKGLMSTFRLLNDAVMRFTDSGTRQDKVLGDVLQNVRALLPVFALLGDKIDQTQAVFDRLNLPTDQLQKAFDLAKNSAWGKWNSAVAEIKTSFIELGGILSGPIISIVQKVVAFIKNLVEHFQSLSKEKQNMVIMFTAIAAAIGPLSLIFGQLIGFIKIFISLLGIAGGWVTLFVAMGAAIYYTYKNWDLFTQAVKNFSFKGLWDDFNIWLNDVIGFGANLDKQVKKWDEYAQNVKGAEAIQSQIVEKQKQYNALMAQLKTSKSTEEAAQQYTEVKNLLEEILNLRRQVLAIDQKAQGGTAKFFGKLQPGPEPMEDFATGLTKSMGLKAQGVVKELQTAFDPQKVGFGDFFGKVFSDMGTDISNGLNMLQKKLTGIDLFKGISAGGGLNLGKDIIEPVTESLKYYAATVEDLPDLSGILPDSEVQSILLKTTELMRQNGDTAIKLGSSYDEIGNAIKILEAQLPKLQELFDLGKMSPEQLDWFKQLTNGLEYLKSYQKTQVNINDIFNETTEKLNANAMAATKLGHTYNKVQRAANILGDAITKIMEDPSTIKNMTEGQIIQLQQMIDQWNEYKSALGESTEELQAWKNVFSSLGALGSDLAKYFGEGFSKVFSLVTDMINGFTDVMNLIKNVTTLVNLLKVSETAASLAKDKDTASVLTNTGAVSANTAAKAANAAANVATTGSNAALSASAASLAVTNAIAAGAWVPFPGNIAAITAGVETVMAAMASVPVAAAMAATGLAKGGIIPDGFPNDSFPAMLQSGEAVIPLKRLPELIGKSGETKMPQKVIFQIKGRTLEGVLVEQGKFKNSF